MNVPTSDPSTPPERLARAARRLRRVLAAIVVVGVLGALGLVAVNLERGAWMISPVLSGSMRPGFAVGGAVISQRVPVGRLTPRAVIVFVNPHHPDELMVHRIVRLTHARTGATLIKTQGDANPVPDPWRLKITSRDAYRVRWSVPLLGYLAVAFQNYRGFFLQFAGLLLILIVASRHLAALLRRRTAPADVEPASPVPALTSPARWPAWTGRWTWSSATRRTSPGAPRCRPRSASTIRRRRCGVAPTGWKRCA